MNYNRILIIQTAFIGDVILATPVIEKIHKFYPQAKIDFFLRKGNEALLHKHPIIDKIWVWDKKKSKYKGLLSLVKEVRKKKYDVVVNLQRFGSTGLLTALSNARFKIGFDKNPFSFFFDERVPHNFGPNIHEVERNIQLISKITDNAFCPPALYPGKEDYDAVRQYKEASYICIAPTSVWYTKQYPQQKWIDFINKIPFSGYIYLLGAPSDFESCQTILTSTSHSNVVNLAGKLSLLQSAALMKEATLNYVNDSAPLHIASAVNAKTCAIFCSTVPEFGFYPLAEFSEIIQIEAPLPCKPCGFHGHQACPLGHFRCALEINDDQLLNIFEKALKEEGYPDNKTRLNLDRNFDI